MKISIVTPCYNSEKTIARTIESVLNQGLGHQLEYIIIDGQSNDSTLSIIKKYANENPNIRYISEKDGSMTEALNKGFKMATGDIVASINADDMYLKGTLKKIITIFEKENVDIVLGNTYFIDSGTLKIKSKSKPWIFSPFLCSLTECPFPECSIAFKKIIFKDEIYFDEKLKYTQDFEMYLRLKKQGYRFSYYNFDMSCFFVSTDNYSSVFGEKMLEEVISYFKYKKLYKCVASKIWGRFIKAALLLRHYYIMKKTFKCEWWK